MSENGKCDYIFTWKIKNYSASYYIDNPIQSPSFYIEYFPGTQWFLTLNPRTPDEIISVFCVLSNRTCVSLETSTFAFSIAIVDDEGCVIESSGYLNPSTTLRKFWGLTSLNISELSEKMSEWNEDILTLRCQIWYNASKIPKTFGSEACTVYEVDKQIFEWDVALRKEGSEILCFSVASLYKFEVTLTSLMEGLEISINLNEHELNISQPKVFKISFCYGNGNRIISKRDKHIFQANKTWKFPYFITKDLLELCYLDKRRYKFKLKCEICFPKQKVSYTSINKFYLNSPNCSSNRIVTSVHDEFKAPPTTALQNDFRTLLMDKNYSDVTIRAGNVEFPSHKLILKVRSPVFKAMFDQNMLENQTNVVDVTDTDGQTMKTFLEFLYTESLEKLDSASAQKLLLVADKYQVQSLLDRCVSLLKSELSVENACEIIAIADSINCECLKTHAFNFIISNADKILVTADWEQWIGENIQLATKLLAKLSVQLMRKY